MYGLDAPDVLQRLDGHVEAGAVLRLILGVVDRGDLQDAVALADVVGALDEIPAAVPLAREEDHLDLLAQPLSACPGRVG